MKIQKLRDSARDQSCVACGSNDGTVVLAHYTGVRRLSFGGGMGKKVHDVVAAHLCAKCHRYTDSLSRDKSQRYDHSEQFLYYCALTWIRWLEQGVLK